MDSGRDEHTTNHRRQRDSRWHEVSIILRVIPRVLLIPGEIVKDKALKEVLRIVR